MHIRNATTEIMLKLIKHSLRLKKKLQSVKILN